MPAIIENVIAPARDLLQHRGKPGIDRDRHPPAGLFLHHGNATVSDIGPFHRHHVADALARVEQEVQSETQLLVPRGADSEEKHEPVSDTDTALVDSLKVLDPERPIREATELLRRREMTRGARTGRIVIPSKRLSNVMSRRSVSWLAAKHQPLLCGLLCRLAI